MAIKKLYNSNVHIEESFEPPFNSNYPTFYKELFDSEEVIDEGQGEGAESTEPERYTLPYHSSRIEFDKVGKWKITSVYGYLGGYSAQSNGGDYFISAALELVQNSKRTVLMSLGSSSGPIPDNQEYVIPPVEKIREVEFIVEIPESNDDIYIDFEKEDSYSIGNTYDVGGYITLERVG